MYCDYGRRETIFCALMVLLPLRHIQTYSVGAADLFSEKKTTGEWWKIWLPFCFDDKKESLCYDIQMFFVVVQKDKFTFPFYLYMSLMVVRNWQPLQKFWIKCTRLYDMKVAKWQGIERRHTEGCLEWRPYDIVCVGITYSVSTLTRGWTVCRFYPGR